MTNYELNLMVGGVCAVLTILFFYLIIQPKQHEKKLSKTSTPKKEVDLFSTVETDYFSGTEAQGLFDSEAIRN